MVRILTRERTQQPHRKKTFPHPTIHPISTTISQRLPRLLNTLQIPLPMKPLHNPRLLTQQLPLHLRPHPRQPPPPLQILGIPLIPVRLLRTLPMALGKPQQSRDGLVLHVVYQTADGAGFF